jgi:hypothetical protein
METLITNVSNRLDAKPLIDILDDRTFMMLKVKVCPFDGSFNIWVETLRPETTEQELKDMVLELLAKWAIFGRYSYETIG